MRMINLIILILGLSGIECRYEILKKTFDRDERLESLAESAVLTLLSCYKKQVDTVGGIGITDPTLLNILTTKQPLPVKFFGEDNLTEPPDEIANYTAPHKLHLFVVEASGDQQFHRNLQRALNSQLSGHLATILIIDWPSQKKQKGCSEASNYLWRIWEFSVLNAFYVCVDELKDRVLVYTYNPYTSKAPVPWMLNKTINGYYDHPWSLFIREYHPGNRQICNNLDFVKTHDLGGYRIRCAYHTNIPFHHLTQQHAATVISSENLNVRVATHALEAFNATLELHLISKEDKKLVAGNFIKNFVGEDKYYDKDDISLQFITSIDTSNVKKSYPFMELDFAVMTYHSGEKSQLEKLIGVFDKRTRLGICLVIVATLVFFKVFMRQSIGTATMNVIRIIGNAGLLRLPNGNAPRLYLAGVFILVVTIFGVYQGLLAALLTKPMPLPEIDTLEDLANSQHRIHIPHFEFNRFFTDPRFNGRLVQFDGMCETGKSYFVISPSVACVNARLNLIAHAIKQNFHVSRDAIVPAFAAYHMSENWPLEERFNEILASFVESRIFWYIHGIRLHRIIERAEHREMAEKKRPKSIKLSNLGFAFAFLGIGLSIATFVFAFEVVIKRR